VVLPEIFVFGGLLGAVYALLSLGFSLSYGVARILNLAHGSFYMIGGYAYYVFLTLSGVNSVESLVLAVALTFLLGIALYLGLVRPVRSAPVRVLLITLSAAIVVQEVVSLSFGDRGVGAPFIIGGISSPLGVVVENQRILAAVVSLAMFLGVWLLIRITKLGRAVRAVAQDAEAASLMGINDTRISLITLGLSGATAGLAGALLGPLTGISPDAWLNATVVAFAVVILGGLGSIPGTFLAAFLVSYSQIVVAFEISSSYEIIVPLAVIAVAVLVRPKGLLGKVEE
jgi:branched-chain amino acid transport system permease protein